MVSLLIYGFVLTVGTGVVFTLALFGAAEVEYRRRALVESRVVQFATRRIDADDADIGRAA